MSQTPHYPPPPSGTLSHSLGYVDSAQERDPAAHLITVIGVVMLSVGTVVLLHALVTSFADLARIGDPFYRRSGLRGRISGLPPAWFMASMVYARVVSSALQVAGGLGCIGRPRAWARGLLMAYAPIEAVSVLANMVVYMSLRFPAGAPPFLVLSDWLSRFGAVAASLGLPILVFFLVLDRRRWS